GVLAAVGGGDGGGRDGELREHRRRDLARERAFELPVDVLCVHTHGASLPEALQRRGERHVRGTDDDVDAFDVLGEMPDARGEDPCFVGALEHLPVAGDEHQAFASGIAATPGSSLPSSSSSEAPPPVETQETRSASPRSWSARTEPPPPTTV